MKRANGATALDIAGLPSERGIAKLRAADRVPGAGGIGLSLRKPADNARKRMLWRPNK
jgi:hypothetical protein